MQRFRIVFLDPEGRPQAYDDVVCKDDLEAARLVKATGYKEEIEIWGDDSLLRRLNCKKVRADAA
jgi:hypothetical protein